MLGRSLRRAGQAHTFIHALTTESTQAIFSNLIQKMKTFYTICLSFVLGRALGTTIPDAYPAEVVIETVDVEPKRPAEHEAHVYILGAEDVSCVPKAFGFP